jgi:hypothetical protein
MQLLSSLGSDSHPIFQGIRNRDSSHNYLPFSLPSQYGYFQLILFVFRLVDELVLLYKESATRKSREIMRNHIVGILVLLQK